MRERDNQNFPPFLPLLLLRRILHFLIQPSFHIFCWHRFPEQDIVPPNPSAVVPEVLHSVTSRHKKGTRRARGLILFEAKGGKRFSNSNALYFFSLWRYITFVLPSLPRPHARLNWEARTWQRGEKGFGWRWVQNRKKKRRTGSIGRDFDDFRKCPTVQEAKVRESWRILRCRVKTFSFPPFPLFSWSFPLPDPLDVGC